MQRNKGFTLIELLVVIAIISILASILFPVFARTRENARRSSCMSNLKQIGLGVMQYTQDYDERYPRTWNTLVPPLTDRSVPGGRFIVEGTTSGTNYSGYYPTWMDFIFPYVKSVQVFVCPSVNINPNNPSYGYSGVIGGRQAQWYDSSPSRGVSPLALSEIRRPAEIVMVMDYNSRYSPYANSVDIGNIARESGGQNYRIVAPHLEGGVVAYTDGHAKWMTRAKMRAIAPANGRCDLSNTSTHSTNGYCDRDWNPFID